MNALRYSTESNINYYTCNLEVCAKCVFCIKCIHYYMCNLGMIIAQVLHPEKTYYYMCNLEI